MEGSGSGWDLQPSSAGSLVSVYDVTPLIYALMHKFLMLGHLELMFQVNGECSSGMAS